MAAADVHLISLIPGLGGCGAPSKAYGIMAAGRPFIASVDAGSEPALIAEEAQCGFVVQPGSVTAVASAIREARDAPLREMGMRAHAEFVRRYERSVVTSSFAALVETLTPTGQGTR